MDKVKNFWNGNNNDHPYLNRASVSALSLALITTTALTALFLTQTQFIAFASQFSTLHFWGAYGVISSAVILPTTALLLALFFQNKKLPGEIKEKNESKVKIDSSPVPVSKIEEKKHFDLNINRAMPHSVKEIENFFSENFLENYADSKAQSTTNTVIPSNGKNIEISVSVYKNQENLKAVARRNALETSKPALIFRSKVSLKEDKEEAYEYSFSFLSPNIEEKQGVVTVISGTDEEVKKNLNIKIEAGHINPEKIVYSLAEFLKIADSDSSQT